MTRKNISWNVKIIKEKDIIQTGNINRVEHDNIIDIIDIEIETDKTKYVGATEYDIVMKKDDNQSTNYRNHVNLVDVVTEDCMFTPSTIPFRLILNGWFVRSLKFAPYLWQVSCQK